MTMTKSIFHIQPLPRALARPLSVAALLVVLALSIGGALAERMEQRASDDRLSVGDVSEQG